MLMWRKCSTFGCAYDPSKYSKYALSLLIKYIKRMISYRQTFHFDLWKYNLEYYRHCISNFLLRQSFERMRERVLRTQHLSYSVIFCLISPDYFPYSNYERYFSEREKVLSLSVQYLTSKERDCSVFVAFSQLKALTSSRNSLFVRSSIMHSEEKFTDAFHSFRTNSIVICRFSYCRIGCSSSKTIRFSEQENLFYIDL